MLPASIVPKFMTVLLSVVRRIPVPPLCTSPVLVISNPGAPKPLVKIPKPSPEMSPEFAITPLPPPMPKAMLPVWVAIMLPALVRLSDPFTLTPLSPMTSPVPRAESVLTPNPEVPSKTPVPLRVMMSPSIVRALALAPKTPWPLIGTMLPLAVSERESPDARLNVVVRALETTKSVMLLSLGGSGQCYAGRKCSCKGYCCVIDPASLP